MLQSSPAIEKSKAKILCIRVSGLFTIISDGKNPDGKWHIIDMAIGSPNQVVKDLKSQGYAIKKF